MQGRLAKSNVLFVLLAFGSVGLVVVAVILLTGKSPEIRVPDQGVLEIQVRDLIAQEVSKAKGLAEEGKHMEAARVLASAAGAQRALLPSEPHAAGSNVPTVIERTALQQLSLIGKDQAYREWLRTLYPEWKTESMPAGLFRD